MSPGNHCFGPEGASDFAKDPYAFACLTFCQLQEDKGITFLLVYSVAPEP